MSKEKILALKMPNYSKGEEAFSTATHIVGGGIGVVILIINIVLGILMKVSSLEMFSLIVYGISAITLYSISSIYHGLHSQLFSKRIMRIIDHCTIYFLIAGTYTPICILGMMGTQQMMLILIIEWIGAVLGITLNAIDLSSKFVQSFSMALYILMGWAMVFVPGAPSLLPTNVFLFILAGGILYTIGSILYGVGHHKKWFHSIFHIFVDLGTLVQFVGVILLILSK